VTDHTPGDLTAGARLAGYRIEDRIGSGGMAVVYRAYDLRLDRLVALKVLAPALARDEAFRRRFIRESRAAAAVDHPHIIPVFEAGEADDVLFIAMRFVRGGDVRSLLDRIGPLPAPRAAEIVTQAASALDAAHAIGLVHRDVKPGNLLLDGGRAPDRPDHLYLSDFGLSKASLAVSGLTATGQFLGTLEYVAPEQIEGRPVDGRTDLYGLACAAFELLCGESPFRREDSLAVMYAQLNEAPPRITARRPDLPAAIDGVLARALAKAPADRYPSCRDFAAAMRTALPAGDIRPQAARQQIAGEPRRAAPPPMPAGAGHTEAAGAAHTEAAEIRPEPRRPDFPPAEHLYRAAPGRAAPGRTAERTEPSRADLQSDDGPRRPWWRSPLPVAGVCAVALLAGGGAYALAGRGTGDGFRALPVPGCTKATARAPALTSVGSATASPGGKPFGIAVDGQYSFITNGNDVNVFHDAAGSAPVAIRSIAAGQGDKGETITPDGKYLLAAENNGAAVISVAAAEQGAPNAVVGLLASPGGKSAAQVLISPGGGFAFVTMQSSAEMAVFSLRMALAKGFNGADFVGFVPLGNQPVGMATDGTWLYVANVGGTLSVVSLHQAESHPSGAVVATAQGGCGPDRVLLSPDGQVLWVTARGSDALLGFSTARLRTDPLHALMARVMVGAVPLGLAFADHGSRIVVGDSNLGGSKRFTTNLAVVSTASALAGKQALLGYVPTGLLPRTVALEPDGSTLLITDQNSGQVQAVRVADLP